MGFNFDIYDLDSYNEPLSKEPISEKNNENSSPIFSNKKDKANFDFDVYDSESNPVIGQSGEKPEGFLKNTARTLLQIPQGVLEATTYGITTGLGALLGQGEISDPEEIERIRQASERAGKPFDEEAYLQAGQKALGAYPTISNIGRKIEEKTGIPLEPKTRFQKFLRFGSTAGKAIPKPSQAAPKGYGFRGTNTGLPRPILGAGVSSISQLLQEFGIPEPFADILSFGSVKPIEATGSRLNIGKERG
jgi:hypothetical protein